MTKVGTKYQVIIDLEARRRLGIRPGWMAVQTVVGDRLEMRFLPPEHEERTAWEAHVEEEWGSR